MSIGYACLTVGVPGTELSGCILRNATEENLRRIISINLTALEAMIQYNIDNQIRLFRISSDIIPFGSHEINQLQWWEDYKDILKKIGRKISEAGIRVSMHPGQYTVLNSSDSRVVYHAVRDLEYQERFLSSLQTGYESKLILHIGGVYGDKKKALQTFGDNYIKLEELIKKRLVIENDDRNYNIEDTLHLSEECGISVVFDSLHHKINPPSIELPDSIWINRCKATWSAFDGKQKMHYSQQKEGAKPGSHSDTIIAQEFLSYYKDLPDPEIDIMLEVKDKNLSALKCIRAVEEYEMHNRDI